MVTGEPGYFDTRAAALWDDENLYVSFWVEEPFPEAHMTERDGIVFAENDVEIFIDGGDCYYEFELNAANTVYEVFFIWQDAYRRGGRVRRARVRPARAARALLRGRLRPPGRQLLAGHASARPPLGVPRVGPARPAHRRACRRQAQRPVHCQQGLERPDRAALEEA
jgi:hypothetical protein